MKFFNKKGIFVEKMTENTKSSLQTALTNIVQSMNDAPVLVIGDIMLDLFVYGHVERISPESPVPVLSISRENRMLGGAGNVLANLSGLGTKAEIISVIGDDVHGEDIKAQTKAFGIDTSGLLIEKNRPTTVKTRYLAGHQQLLRTDFEKKQAISDETATKVLEKAKILIKNVKALIISDYGKGLLTDTLISNLIALAKEQDIPVLVDPKGCDYSRYRGASIVTPNKSELSEATGGMDVNSDEAVIKAGNKLLDDSGIKAVIATRSGDGISIIQTNADPVHLRTKPIEIFDVSGAGDTVISTIAAAIAAKGNIIQATELANMAGSIVVAKVGTAPVRAKELLEAIEEHDEDKATNKPNNKKTDISDWDAADEQVRRWKARGLKVGFTNGCFDILHYGHVAYLTQARSKCDRLIIAMNSDASVRVLKGSERPIHDEESRAAVLSALSSTDMVILFGAELADDDNTACALLEKIQPDLYFKGGDYTIDQIPEAPIVQAYGGSVSVMQNFEGHSTTSSLKKMA